MERVIAPNSIVCLCGCGDMVKIGEDCAERLDVWSVMGRPGIPCLIFGESGAVPETQNRLSTNVGLYICALLWRVIIELYTESSSIRVLTG